MIHHNRQELSIRYCSAGGLFGHGKNRSAAVKRGCGAGSYWKRIQNLRRRMVPDEDPLHRSARLPALSPQETHRSDDDVVEPVSPQSDSVTRSLARQKFISYTSYIILILHLISYTCLQLFFTHLLRSGVWLAQSWVDRSRGSPSCEADST